ncbi:7-deoxyloganetic acid glucosyltransferase-like [Dioscorea cayenensis subsp. rotundata]|uniref:Glycosyltransferase n=1 Tax=Dioscorea cayennensis subsp. rotundata TaxID=55577 RepID=A0AB40BLP3_DIOCR|nr:7-deoxyloganetic acid glucosyltransferase-like [Dioscorea cayenensis subsp. rotundata]
MVAHVLVFPFPAQGHLNSMLKLAELLSLSGLHITFLTTDYHYHRLCLHSPTHARLSRRPGFWFRSISDGLTDQRLRSADRILELYESLTYNSSSLFRDLLISNQNQDGWPRITSLVVDGIMPFAMDVANDLGIPTIAFRTSSPCSIWTYFSLPSLVQAGEFPFPAEEADLDKRVYAVTGMESFLRRRDLPGFFRQARDISHPFLDFVYAVTLSTTRAKAFILNSLEAMDGTVLSHIRTVCPTTYAIGPLHSMLTSMSSHVLINSQSDERSTNSATLRREDRSCLTWLDNQPKGSVLYVSFGSFTVITNEDLLEFWHGLVNSGQRFLWVIRSDLVNGVEKVGSPLPSLSVPPGVVEGTSERGCLVAWAPQEDVLAHPSVGCFLTHSGWNSTLESVVAGVPMICWPFFVDQQITSRYVSEVWKIGLDMKDMHGREIVERMVRDAMEGEKAQELKRSAAAMAEKAKESIREGGSSYLNFQSLVHYLKSTDDRSGQERLD